jgi:hypothetical protein
MSKLATRKRTVKKSANRRTKHNSIRKSNLRRKVGGSKKRVRKSLKRGGANVTEAVTGTGTGTAPVTEAVTVTEAAPVTEAVTGTGTAPVTAPVTKNVKEIVKKIEILLQQIKLPTAETVYNDFIINKQEQTK